MYRCYGCDAPAQSRCGDFCQALQKEAMKSDDPYGWKEEPIKLDIEAGVRVRQQEEVIA